MRGRPACRTPPRPGAPARGAAGSPDAPRHEPVRAPGHEPVRAARYEPVRAAPGRPPAAAFCRAIVSRYQAYDALGVRARVS